MIAALSFVVVALLFFAALLVIAAGDHDDLTTSDRYATGNAALGRCCTHNETGTRCTRVPADNDPARSHAGSRRAS